MAAETMIPTTVTRIMLASMARTHDRRRISVYSGPPGIGKTTAINAFVSCPLRDVALVEPFTRRTTLRMIYQEMIKAVRRISPSRYSGIEGHLGQLSAQLWQEMRIFAGVTAGEKIDDIANAPNLTFVFDEAQNIPHDALDALRHLNEWTPYFNQIKIELIFVCNQRFSLEIDKRGRNAMLDAFKDRVLDTHAFRYSDLTNKDLGDFISARGVVDRIAQELILRAFSTARGSRSLRRIADLVDDIMDEAGDAPVTADIVNSILNPV